MVGRGGGGWIAGVLVIVACACKSATSPTPAQNGPITITGRILDAATSEAVPSLGLIFGTQRVVTDSSGRYDVSVPAGDYQVQADGEPSAEVIRVRGPWTSGDLLVSKVACGIRYGNVTDARTGRPVVGAAVRSSASVFTDANGWYRLEGGCGPCGSCNTAIVTVDASGYRTFSTGVGRGFRDIQRLDVDLVRQ